MGNININGKNYNYQGADASNSVIKAGNGKYYKKGADGKYHEIKQNGQSIFNDTAKKSADAKKKAQAAANYNKQQGFKQNKKYYVVGNSSYFTMVDKNYNTVYYKDNQQITKEQFLQGANCTYDARNKRYIAKDAGKKAPVPKNAKRMPNSKTGMYYIETKQGRRYFEPNGIEISERAFLDKENAYVDGDGKIAKYDWKAKAKNAAKGIGNMFADMFTEEVPVTQKDPKTGKEVVVRNKDGSPKTSRKFSLTRTATTVVVGAVVAGACVLAAPVAATAAAAIGIGAGAAATIGTVVGVGAQLGIAGYFGYQGYKQMDDANEANKNVLLSNNERMENWKKKGAGGAQVGMSLLMVKGAAKNAPKTHATARNTAKVIETKNNATLMAKGKVGLRDRFANARSGLNETVGKKGFFNTVKEYHKNNSFKTELTDAAKAPIKVGAKVVKETVKETLVKPTKFALNTGKTVARIATKKGRVKNNGNFKALKNDFKEWKNSFKENPQDTPALTPEQAKAQREANTQFEQNLSNMPKEAEAKVQQYEALIENTTDKNQVAQLLDAIKNDKDLTKAQRAEVATKFFEKNDAQYPGVLKAGYRQKAEIGLEKAKTLEDIKQVDREALPAKKQKVFDKKKTEFEKKEIKKASLDELKQMDREALTEESKAAFDKRKAKLEKKAQKAENGGTFYDNRIKPTIDGAKAKAKDMFKRKSAKTNEPAQNVEQNAQQAAESKVSAEFEQEVNNTNPALKTESGRTLKADVVEANVKASVEGLIKKAKNKAELEAINAKLDKIASDKTITKSAREVILKQKDLVNAAIKKLNRQNTFVGKTVAKAKNGFSKVKDAIVSKAKGKIKTEPKCVEPDFKNLTETKTIDKATNTTTSVYKNSKGETVYTKEVFDYGDGFPTEVIKDANGREIYSTNTRFVVNSGETCMSETRTTYDANGLKYKEYVTEYKADGKTVDLKYTEKFDAKGNCIEHATDNGKQVWEYNENGQMIKETETGFSLAKGKKKVTTYEYDTQGNQVRCTETIGNDVAITDIIRTNDGTERYITSRKGVVEEVWVSNRDGATTYYYSKDGKLMGTYEHKKTIDIKYLEDGRIELTELVDNKPQTSTISMNEFKAKYGDLVEAPKVKSAKPVEAPKVEESKVKAQSEVKSEAKAVEAENNFAKFDEMIAKSSDMSDVRAKLSNNPEFNKLSPAEQRQLIGKINQREAILEATPKETPKASNKEYDIMNWFDNIKDVKAPSLGGLNVVKTLDDQANDINHANLVLRLEDEEREAQQAMEESVVESESEVDTEDEEVQENGEQEEVTNPEDTGDVENPEESGDADDTNPDDASNNTKDSEGAPASEPEPETPASEPQAPVAEHKDGGSAQAPSAPTTPTTPDTPSAQNDSAVKDTTPKSSAPDSAKGDSSVAPEQPAPAQSDKANDSKKVEDSKKDTVGQVDGEKKKDNAVQDNSQEERDLPAPVKRNITQQVLEAKSDDQIADALQTLRDVGRFKGRKNLRRLLKAKRKHNQERVEKYQEKVEHNINEINEAYRKKLED